MDLQLNSNTIRLGWEGPDDGRGHFAYALRLLLLSCYLLSFTRFPMFLWVVINPSCYMIIFAGLVFTTVALTSTAFKVDDGRLRIAKMGAAFFCWPFFCGVSTWPHHFNGTNSSPEETRTRPRPGPSQAPVSQRSKPQFNYMNSTVVLRDR